jgi:hypothetical protein
MHNLETLAADLAPFFKKGGNNGYSGNGSCKQLNLCDSAVTTRRGRMSPVSPRVVTGPESSGDAKSERSEPFNKGVNTVASVTTGFEEGAASPLPADCPSEWQAIWKELKRSEPPSWASAERWRELAADAEGFLMTWGNTADRLGWTTLDLFGVHPTAPTARFDVMGLIPILRGRSVCVLTEKTATIECKSGAKLTRYPPTGAGAVLITRALHSETRSAQ